MYKDADGVDHRVGEDYHGDNRYYIEFKEDGGGYLVSTDFLAIYVSSKEYFSFRAAQ
jgi:hypothetical protein